MVYVAHVGVNAIAGPQCGQLMAGAFRHRSRGLTAEHRAWKRGRGGLRERNPSMLKKVMILATMRS
jgi:hypothetical protein